MSDASADTIRHAVDLRTLVAHAHTVPATAPVEQVQAEFARHDVDFLAVLDGDRLAGVSSRRELTAALGSRFGFALHAKRPVIDLLMTAPLQIATGGEITELFQAAAARDRREFYDDVVLVDEAGRYEGMIPMRTLVRLQTEFLLANIDRVEASRREIETKNRQMEDDLRMAREVQFAMLPREQVPLVAPGRTLHFAHYYRPAGGMSGDFFDTVNISDTAGGILVCDVMGHGVRSALITAMVRAMLEQLHPVAADPGRLLTRLNRDLTRILRQTGALIFVTAAYAVIDLGADRIRYAQAGHPPPLRSAATGGLRPLRCTDAEAGPALGLIDDFEFATVEESFAPGDRVVFFTDGIFEAASVSGEEYGPDRIAQTLGACMREPLDAWLQALLADVTRFAGTPFADDVCLVAAELRRA